MEDLLERKKPSDRNARAGGVQSPGLQGVPVRFLAKEETEEKISVGRKGLLINTVLDKVGLRRQAEMLT